MALNVHQLHIFYTVAERGTFSAAAQALHMTQPAVTMQVQALEEWFGTKLLNRTTKKLELTEAGHHLLPQARKAVELMRETDAVMAKFAEQLKGRLQFAASLTLGEYVLPPMLSSFLRRHPELSISMKVMNTTDIIEAIANQGVDFGLIEAPCEEPGFHAEPIMDDELVLVVPKGHRFADLREVALSEVVQEPMVLREKGSGTRQVMEDELLRHGVSADGLRVVSDFESSGAIKSAVEEGLGVSVLSAWAVRKEVAAGVLRAVPIRGVAFRRQFFVVRLKSSLLSVPAAALLREIGGAAFETS